MLSRKQVRMRVRDKKRVTIPVQRRSPGIRSGERGTGVTNPFRKLRGAGVQHSDVDRYLAAVRGR